LLAAETKVTSTEADKGAGADDTEANVTKSALNQTETNKQHRPQGALVYLLFHCLS